MKQRNNLKGWKVKVMSKKKWKGLLKSWGNVELDILQVKIYVATLLTKGFSIDMYRKGLNAKLPMANHWYQL